MAESCALLGAGCREGRSAAGAALLEFWLPPAAADAGTLEAALRARGLDARVEAAREDPGWREATRAFHRPVEIAGVLRVRPPWSPRKDGLAEVVIDPGMAFGTAQHATTRSCLEILAGLPAGGPLADVGCGSGVLAIAARRLGYDPVWAVDSDPLAVEATLANARRNGAGLRVGRREIGADALPAAPTVLANLTATVLTLLAGALAEPPPRRLVVSGMRPDELPGVAAAFAPRGLVPTRTITADDWTTALLERR